MNENCGCKISGIKCEVETCRYHTVDNCCEAGKIEVGPHKAQKSGDTACNTFEQKI
ncbi:MAG: DUF1540 domain-containing protein [Ruminococcaceae bacterium]|nr:DUF1540 domain-containing protein [Oscillospiraceae bacterium]